MSNLEFQSTEEYLPKYTAQKNKGTVWKHIRSPWGTCWILIYWYGPLGKGWQRKWSTYRIQTYSKSQSEKMMQHAWLPRMMDVLHDTLPGGGRHWAPGLSEAQPGGIETSRQRGVRLDLGRAGWGPISSIGSFILQEPPAYPHHVRPDVVVHVKEPWSPRTSVGTGSGSEHFILVLKGSRCCYLASLERAMTRPKTFLRCRNVHKKYSLSHRVTQMY